MFPDFRLKKNFLTCISAILFHNKKLSHIAEVARLSYIDLGNIFFIIHKAVKNKDH